MKKIVRTLAIGTVTLSMSFAFGACSNPIEKAIEKQTGVNVKTDKDGNVKVKTKDGDAEFGAGTSLPESFPKDVPLPKGGKLIGATSAPDHWILQYEGVSIATLTDLTDRIKAAGGTSSYEMQSDVMRNFMFEFGDYSIQTLLMIDGDVNKPAVLSYTVAK